jgi:DNA repair protein RadC
MKLPEIKLTISFDKKVKKSELIQIKSSKDSADLFRTIFNSDTMDWLEECIILCLNRANKVVGFYKLSSGGTTGTVVDPKVVFTIALNCAASAVIIAHNHPSGALRPSSADLQITNKLVAGGKLLDVHVLDHIILTDDSYYSFSDNGDI